MNAIEESYSILSEKVAKGYAITLEEFRNIVVPWVRNHRETMFEVNPLKQPKEKKITKKEIKETLIAIAAKPVSEVTKEDIDFINIRLSEVVLSQKITNQLLSLPGIDIQTPTQPELQLE